MIRINSHLICLSLFFTGSQSGYVFQFKNPVSLVPGTNNLTLLSVTVGLQVGRHTLICQQLKMNYTSLIYHAFFSLFRTMEKFLKKDLRD